MSTNNSINTNTNNYLQTANNLSDLSSATTGASNLFVTNTISTTYSITTADYAKVLICTGSSPYTVSYSLHTAGTYLQIVSQTTSNALITITSAPGGTFNGQSNLIIGPGDSVKIYDDGTNFTIMSIVLQPVDARIYLGTSQSVAGTTNTRILYDTATYDIGPSFDLVTNIGRATPLWPGKYEVFGQGTILNPVNASEDIISILKNSTNTAESVATTINTVSRTFTINNSMSMNGSTDFIEIFFNNAGVAAKSLSGLSTDTCVTLNRVSLF